MAIHDLTQENLSFHCARIESVTTETPRLWGEMTGARMIRHLRSMIELTLDDPEGKVKIVAPPVIRSVVTWLFFDLYTNWPKGKMKANCAHPGRILSELRPAVNQRSPS